MKLAYQYVALPKVWPGKRGPANAPPRRKAPFKSMWTTTEQLLARELAHLGAKDVTIAVDIRNPGFFRADGMLRADARPVTPAVIVAFTDRGGVRMQFPCETYGYWADNVHAIALALESLRRVDRYGVTQGDQQYVGFRALPPGGGSPSAPARMSEDRALEVLAAYHPFPAHLVVSELSVAGEVIKMAKRKAHPDSGGTQEDFVLVGEAADVIEALHAAGEPG